MEIPKALSSPRTLLLLALIILAVAWRLIAHEPNFAPVGAIALLGGTALGWRNGLLLTLIVIGVSDLLIGTYPGMAWTWLGYGLIVTLGVVIANLPFAWRVGVGALGSSLLFYLISNFGTWLSSGMYTHDLTGAIECYVMALPFLRATLLSDVLFVVVLFSSHELIAAKIGNVRSPKRNFRLPAAQVFAGDAERK